MSRPLWADKAPFKSPQLALCVAWQITEKQGHHQVWLARCRGPRTSLSTSSGNLDCAFVKSTPEFVVPENGRASVPLVPPSRPPGPDTIHQGQRSVHHRLQKIQEKMACHYLSHILLQRQKTQCFMKCCILRHTDQISEWILTYILG